MKYSIILLNYDPENKKPWIADTRKAIEENSQGYEYELIEVRDVKGYVNAVNEGFARATGDYLIVCNDDIVIQDKEWLPKLTSPNSIVSYAYQQFYLTKLLLPDASCFGLSRKTQKVIGDMDIAFENGYGCDDIDYFYRALEAGINTERADVGIRHLENQTYKMYFGGNKSDMTEKNVGIFYDKWKEKLNLPV